MDIFACCIRRPTAPDPHDPSPATETTRLLSSEQASSTPTVIERQPEAIPPPIGAEEREDDELDAIFGDMVGTMVRPKQANPFLTGTGQTPSTSRNPSPRSVGASSRGQRSHSRGRTTNAFQVRRVRLGRDGQKLSSGPDAVQEEDEAAQAAAAAAAAASGAGQGDADSLRSGTSEAPTRASTLNREELERQKYTIKLKTAEVVKPWRSQISQGD